MRRVWDVYSECKSAVAQQGLSFLHTPLAACGRPEGQPVPSSVPLWRPHSAQSSWGLQACGVGRPVIDHCSLPN